MPSACHDQDLFVEAGLDLLLISPDDQSLAEFRDGVIDAATPWSVTSATSDFSVLAADPLEGRILALKPVDGLPGAPARQLWRPNGVVLRIAAVAADRLDLQRIKPPPGLDGHPPGPTTGSLSGFEARVPYLDPQIDEAQIEIDAVLRFPDRIRTADHRRAVIHRALAILFHRASQQTQNDMLVAKRDYHMRRSLDWITIADGRHQINARQAMIVPMRPAVVVPPRPPWPELTWPCT